jgi:hypothetical protein
VYHNNVVYRGNIWGREAYPDDLSLRTSDEFAEL